MKDERRERDGRELGPQPVVGAGERGDGLRGRVSPAISGSASIAATAAASREKSLLLSVSTGRRGAIWLSPLIRLSPKSGAGTL